LGATDRVVLEVARVNPTDGTRMVTAFASRELNGQGVSRKRVQRFDARPRLLQPKRSEGRRKRPGFFQVTSPDELWHLGMTSVCVAERGWCYPWSLLGGDTQAVIPRFSARTQRSPPPAGRLKSGEVEEGPAPLRPLAHGNSHPLKERGRCSNGPRTSCPETALKLHKDCRRLGMPHARVQEE
jgi:hypothetical protein